MTAFYLWDLDSTLIDSSHRWNGCVTDWIRNSTPENIEKDTLLPLVDLYKSLIEVPNTYHFCVTSRELTEHDHKFLRKRDIFFNEYFHRGMLPESQKYGSCAYTKDLLCGQVYSHIAWLSQSWILSWFTIDAFEDKPENLEVFRKHGIVAHDSIKINQYLENNTMNERYFVVMKDVTGQTMRETVGIIDLTNSTIHNDSLTGTFEIINSKPVITESSNPTQTLTGLGLTVTGGRTTIIDRDTITALKKL